MDKDKLIRQLMGTFLEELKDHVQALNRDLLALEKGPAAEARAELLKTVFRAFHSLKGAARSVGVGPVEEISHCLEDILAPVRDGRRALTPELFQLLFSAVDAIERTGRVLREGGDLKASPAASMLAQARAAAGMPQPGEPQASAEAPAAAGEPSEENTLRVPAERIDVLLAHGGELLVARRKLEARSVEAAGLSESAKDFLNESRRSKKAAPRAAPGRPQAGRGETRLDFLAKNLERFSAGLAADLRGFERFSRPMEENLRQMRMAPFSQGCAGLERAVRDLAKAAGKEVELRLVGGDVELDRAVLEALKAPLLHLVRNSVDHGIENPEDRRQAGKPRLGAITITAALRGDRVDVAIQDDGRGVDLAAIRERAERNSIPLPADERDTARLIFRPGFSTKTLVTEVSGRGVGLDVVKSAVESLHGTVDFQSSAGRGSRFVLTVPLTLTIVRAVLASASGQFFAFLAGDVRTLARIGPDELRSVEGRDAAFIDGNPVALTALAQVLGLPGREPALSPGRSPAVILAWGGRQAGFLVDELLSEQEIVIKGLGPRIGKVAHVGGATIMPTGKVALILNASGLIEDALARPSKTLAARSTAEETPKKRVLLAEDSITTRTLEKNILEAAGYEVVAAADGAQGWQLLQERGADIVVSDVEMPRLDGIALVEAIRGSKRFRDLPVILLTALEKDEEKARGLEAGADAYLLKSAFDQKELLATIAQLI